jgi:hypothetical protein
MVAEALLTLDRPDSVIPWIEGYKNRFQDRPQPQTPISRAGWREVLGDRGRSANTPPPSLSGFMPPAEAPETLIDRAVAAGGAHTIKFTEACLREYALNPQPVYLVAARDAAERVGRV